MVIDSALRENISAKLLSRPSPCRPALITTTVGVGEMLSPALLASLAEPVGPRATLEVVISIAALTVGLSLELREEEKPT